jgi:hypothetical protein
MEKQVVNGLFEGLTSTLKIEASCPSRRLVSTYKNM